MAITYAFAALQPGVALAATSAAIYTAPSATSARVSRAVFTNTTGAAVTYTVSVIRAGKGALVLINSKTIAANGADTAPEMAALVLLTGDVVTASCSVASAVNALVSGFTAV